jgi:Fic family protein
MKFQRVDELKKKLDEHRPLDSALAKKLREVYRVEWTYHSNAIEGNTLTLLETKLVLEEGLTVGNGKSLKEHLEAVNHAEAIDYLEEIVSKNEPLTERLIKHIHYLVLKNIDNQNAGQYRKVNVRISGSQHVPPDFLFVPEEMEKLMKWYDENETTLHPIELSAIFHHRFVYIHPFIDGNGRTARLLMNLILMKNGYPPAIIKSKPENRLAYYQCLEEASVNQRLDPFIDLVSKCVEESLKDYLHALGIDH